MARLIRKPSAKQQPVAFHETLTPVVPYAPAAPTIPEVRAGIPDRYLKAGLYLVWALAAIFAGISIGMMSINSMKPVSTEAPVPVAKSDVKVATVSVPTLQLSAVSPQAGALTVKQATAVTQAQAGNITASLSGGVLQHTADSDSLQPGFTHYGLSQGKLGTQPVTHQ
jgi:hypothetical protein